MKLPHPNVQQIEINRPTGFHAGLWFNRHFWGYDDAWQVSGDDKKKFLMGCASSAGPDKILNKCLDEACTGIEQLANSQGGQSRQIELKKYSKYATGLGQPHPLEVGFSFHATWGVPFMRGQALKGLLRSWIDDGWCESELIRSSQLQLLGGPASSGALIFFDALPKKAPAYLMDILNPHTGGFGVAGHAIDNLEGPEGNWKNVPGDWHNPVPVFFLSVKEMKLQLALAARATLPEGIDLKAVLDELLKALQLLGAGAKTSSGFGKFDEA